MASLGTLLSREVTMQTKIDRRSFLAAAVLGCSSILVPREAFSLPQGGLPESEPVTIYANPGKTLGQIEAELHAHAENEARRIIAEAMSQNNGGITPFGRPTYSTVYGTTQYKRTGVKPYVVYVTQDGVRKVYRKNASRQLYSVELNKRRV